MKNLTVIPKTSKFDVLNVVRYIVLYKLQQKTLTFCHRIAHFLDIRTVKIKARNYVVVMSLYL